MAENGPTIISRAEARTFDLPRYFTGKPCKRGHIAERTIRNKTCVACDLARKVDNPTVKARLKAYYRANRNQVLAQSKTYQEANAKTIRAKRKVHREANKERINAKIAEWAKANPEKRRAKERNREARERGAEGSHTGEEITALLIRQRHRCAAPGCAASLRKVYHADHIQPLAKGGSNRISNIQLLCVAHNQAKSDRDPIEWAQSLGRLL